MSLSTVQGGVYGEGGQLRGEGGQLRGEGGQHRGEGGQLRGKGVHAIHCADDQGIDMALVGKHLCQNLQGHSCCYFNKSPFLRSSER